MIKEFFIDEIAGAPFVLFGLTHFILVITTIIFSVIMHKNRNKLYSINKNKKRKISLFLITFLFINMTIYYLSLAYYGHYDWKVHLPLHLCFISGYLFMYSVLTNKINIYKIVYFFAFIGPIPAILLPDLKSGFDSFLFYQQVISHHVFLLSSLFIFYAYNVDIKIKDMFKSLIVGLGIFSVMYIFNSILETNYIMQNKLPDHVLKLFPFLVDYGHPIYVLLSSGVSVMLLAYLPIYFKNRKDNNICLQGQESLL
jgi:hypothetical integral membrane protein (TIGR02206 family)